MLLRIVIIALLATGIGAATATAKPAVGVPREIVTKVGEQKGIRLLTNDRRNWHWVWVRRPSSKIVVAHAPERLPENEEAVNGLAGRTGIFVTGRSPGSTSGVVGYYSADESKLFKTVTLRITVK
ncbi:MAG: hypothetical protein WCN97_10005 [Thermoleophilia bacterium]